MSKRIIVCCDGTGNDARTNKEVWTNVARLADCIVDNDKQIAGYLYGIGVSRRFNHVSQATGYGLEDKILKAYEFICHSYDPGDSVVLIGFSRGAFTARCVAAFISDVGILSPQNGNIAYIEHIYKEWAKLMSSAKHTEKRRQLLYQYNGNDETRRMVKALVLWDTVSSLHLNPPANYLDLVNTTLPENVEYAFQALSLEEKRGLFPPAIWKGNPPSTVKEIKQCWFRGMHSHVGGSHEQWSNHLANVSLVWMFAQLKEHDIISLDEDQLRRVIASDGTSKERWQSGQDTGLPKGIADSNTTFWQLLAILTGQFKGKRKQGKGVAECFHWSVVAQPGQPIEPLPPLKADTDLSGLGVEPVRLLEEESIGWPGLYFQRTDKYHLTPEEAFGRLLITQRQIFDLERPYKPGIGYELLVRDQRFFNIFYLEKKVDPGDSTPATQGSTSFSVDSSSTTSTAARTIESSTYIPAIAEASGYSYSRIDQSSGSYPVYGGKDATSRVTSYPPNYGMSNTTETDYSAYNNPYSNMRPRAGPSYQTDYPDIPVSENYRGNDRGYYQSFPQTVDKHETTDYTRESQGVDDPRYASNPKGSEEQASYRDRETNQIYSQDSRDYETEDRAERHRRSKGKSSRRRG